MVSDHGARAQPIRLGRELRAEAKFELPKLRGGLRSIGGDVARDAGVKIVPLANPPPPGMPRAPAQAILPAAQPDRPV